MQQQQQHAATMHRLQMDLAVLKGQLQSIQPSDSQAGPTRQQQQQQQQPKQQHRSPTQGFLWISVCPLVQEAVQYQAKGCSRQMPPSFSWWTFRICFIFFCSGLRRRRGGGLVFIETPRRGGEGREGLRRIEEFGGGGENFLFRGRNAHQVMFFSMGSFAQTLFCQTLLS